LTISGGTKPGQGTRRTRLFWKIPREERNCTVGSDRETVVVRLIPWGSCLVVVCARLSSLPSVLRIIPDPDPVRNEITRGIQRSHNPVHPRYRRKKSNPRLPPERIDTDLLLATPMPTPTPIAPPPYASRFKHLTLSLPSENVLHLELKRCPFQTP